MTYSKKKILVPVVALMLCAVAVIGVAYAGDVKTVVTNTGNTADVDKLKIDINYGTGAQNAQFKATTNLVTYAVTEDGVTTWAIDDTTLNMGSAKTITLDAPKSTEAKTYNVMAYYKATTVASDDLDVTFKIGDNTLGTAETGTKIGEITVAANTTSGTMTNVQVKALIAAVDDLESSNVNFGTYTFVFFVTATI